MTRTHRAIAIATAVLIVSSSFPPSTFADAVKPLAETLVGDAKSHYDAAKILYADGDYSGALGKFQRAYELTPDARLLWNMAACEKQMRHYARVLTLVDRYLAEGKKLLSAKDRAQAIEFETAVRGFVGEIKITCNEPGATIFVDDAKVGVAPLANVVLVDQGPRRFRAIKADYVDAIVTETIDGGSKRDVVLELHRKAHLAKLTIVAEADDAIRVDGQPAGTGEWTGAVKSGVAHAIDVSASGKKTRHLDVTLSDDENKTMHVALESDPVRWPWYVGGAVVVAGVVVGGYFLLRSSKSAPSPTEGTLGAYQLP